MSEEKKIIKWDSQEIAVGDTLEFDGDPNFYAVLAINEDGIVVKKLELAND